MHPSLLQSSGGKKNVILMQEVIRKQQASFMLQVGHKLPLNNYNNNVKEWEYHDGKPVKTLSKGATASSRPCRTTNNKMKTTAGTLAPKSG